MGAPDASDVSQRRAIATIFLACALLGACATRPEVHSNDNDGVAAYWAKDYATARTEWRKAVSAGFKQRWGAWVR